MSRRTHDVSQLPNYGKPFPFIPWSARSRARVSLVFARELLRELGAARSALLFAQMPVRIPITHRAYREGFGLMRSRFGFVAELEWILLVTIYERLAGMRGADAAYDFAKRSIQNASLFMMNDFYQADRLAEFDDPFEAFWAYHKAMFAQDANYRNEMIEEPNVRTMIVHRCANCEIAKLTIPDLASLGCDHDITGYRAIEDNANMEFRRPQTLAKDGAPCRFVFYRKGTAPPGDYENH